MKALTQADKEQILTYVSKEPEMNLFFIGDIENYGIASDVVNIYVNEKDGLWDCVLLRYLDFYIIYSQQDTYDHKAVAEFLKGRTVDCISGKTELVKQLAPYFKDWEVQSTYMSRLNQINTEFNCPTELNIRRMTEDDVEDAINLYLTIDEFAKTYQGNVEKNIASMKMNLSQGGSICVGGYVDNQLVCVAETSGDNSISAMIVGVATLEAYRQKGYASLVVQQLCQQVLASGKQFLCLFYDNPKAGRIYHRIGFEEIGEYAMLR